MAILKCIYNLHFVIQFLCIVVSTAETQTRNTNTASGGVPSAIFVFGDSTVDPGNNNYIQTAFKSNFPPYGQDFFNQVPTGRFTNGRLVTDFVASYAGLKEYVPPYLDPNLSMEDLISGVSFASAASGFDPFTARITGVISIPKQVEYFREYKTRIEGAIGKERSQDLINNGIYVISAGTNDFAVNYFGPSNFRRYSYSIPDYYQFLVQQIQHFLQELVELGARTIVVVGIPPVGCLPVVMTVIPETFLERQCVTRLSSVAVGFNQIVEQKVKEMQRIDSKLYYVGIYDTFMDILQDPKKFGFDNIGSGCCGTGLLEMSYLCNRNSKICSNVSKYVFFDAVHPTESTYYILFKALTSTVDLIFKRK